MLHRQSMNKNQTLLGWVLVLPAILILGLFFIYPMFYAIGVSFFKWNLLGAKTFIGLDNYQFLLMEDVLFKKTLINTAYFSFFYIIGSLLLSLGTALLVQKQLRGIKIIRTMILIPVVIPMAITGIIWSLLYEPSGFINELLSLFGIQGKEWLYDSKFAMPAVILVSIWQSFGLYTIIYVTGLQQVPNELYEAMKMDGANKWKSFVHLTLPLLQPTTFFVTTLLLINSFKIFDQIWVMTEGGPGNSTITLVVYMYQKVFSSVGLATAASTVLFIIVLLFVFLQYFLMGREEKK